MFDNIGPIMCYVLFLSYSLHNYNSMYKGGHHEECTTHDCWLDSIMVK